MDLLGPSLQVLFNVCNRKFSVKTVLPLADQMLCRINYLHSINFTHGDLKPANFLIGRGKDSNMIFLINFGLAKRYFDPARQQHIPYGLSKRFSGTVLYASINA